MIPLNEFRRRLGSTPRSFSPDLTKQIRARYWPLLSTAPFDSLVRVFFDQAKLRERGEVVWAQVLQANDFLLNPGLNGESHVATILHAGPELDDPSALERIALRITSAQETPSKGSEQQDAQALLHPSRRKYWASVPPSFAGGREVFCSDLLIFRKLLPPQPKGATLQKLVFPLFVAPDETKMVLQVPSYFWPEEFLAYWES